MNANPTKREIGLAAVTAAAAIARALGHTWAEYEPEWEPDVGVANFKQFVIGRYYTDRGVTRQNPDLFVGALGCGIPAPTVHWEEGRWVISHRSWTGRICYRIWEAQVGGVLGDGGHLNALIEVSRPQGVVLQADLEPTGCNLWASKEISIYKRHWAAALKVVRPVAAMFPRGPELLEALLEGLSNAHEDYVGEDA